ncbi:MAG: hypothetical protein OXG08_06905 [Gammaproteobacteria bacterium]|nr:hypothetical protein [Gammaproteobacteria bacterium]
MPRVTRRTAIKISSGALLAAVTYPYMNQALANEELVEWDDFLSLIRDLSGEQFEESWDQESYTAKVTSVVSKLRTDDEYIEKYIESYRNWSPNFPGIRDLHRESQFMVSLLEFEKGEKIPLHDHPDMTGVILCTQGRVKVDHYDRLQEVSERKRPLLQEERSLEMKPGDIAALTVDKGNIHALHALEFTRMIDVFTPPYNADRINRSRYFKIDSNPYQERPGVFEAVESVSPRFPD